MIKFLVTDSVVEFRPTPLYDLSSIALLDLEVAFLQHYFELLIAHAINFSLTDYDVCSISIFRLPLGYEFSLPLHLQFLCFDMPVALCQFPHRFELEFLESGSFIKTVIPEHEGVLSAIKDGDSAISLFHALELGFSNP